MPPSNFPRRSIEFGRPSSVGSRAFTQLPIMSTTGDEGNLFAGQASDDNRQNSLHLASLEALKANIVATKAMMSPKTSMGSSISSNVAQAAFNNVKSADPVPPELEIRESGIHLGSSGLWARCNLKIGRRFGPLTSVLENDDISSKLKENKFISVWAKNIQIQKTEIEEAKSNVVAANIENQLYLVITEELENGAELVLFNADRVYSKIDLDELIKNQQAFTDSLICELCEESFKSSSELENHRCHNKTNSEERETSSKTSSNNESLDCPVCDLNFSSPQRLEEHCLSVHSSNDPDLFDNHQHDLQLDYKCRKCPKTFNWKSNLNRHQVGHESESGGRNYACENCPKIFTDPSNLQRHIRTQHVGARSHACPECGKTFATSSGLKQHTHIHSSVKPFQCEVCLKAYTQFSNLCRHKRMHANCRMQVKCHKCGQAFSTVTSLSKHKRYCEGVNISQTAVNSSLNSIESSAANELNLNSSAINSNGPPLNSANLMNISGANAVPNPLAFYGRQGLPFYHPSLLGYPLFPGTQQTNHTVNNTLLQQLASSSRVDSAVESKSSAENRFKNGLLAIAEQNKAKKESSVGSDSEISEEIVSSPESDSEIGSEIDLSEKYRSKSTEMFSSYRQGSPKQASVCPASNPMPSDRICAFSPRISTDNEMPFDLSSNKKFKSSKEAVLPDRVASLDGQANNDEQPLDLRVSQKKDVKEVNVHSDGESKHNVSIQGEYIRSEGYQTPTTPTSPTTPNSYNQVDSTSPSPISPNKLSMMYPRPLHPMLLESMYRLQPKFNFPSSADRYISPFTSPRYPYMNPLLNNNSNSAHQLSAFDLMKSQMERLSKPFPEVMSPHLMKSKERYSCKFCGKVFPRSANLTRHLRTHTGEQPYKCKYCERSFSISSNLQRHVRNIHNKEKPFKCHLCDRCFGQQTNLDRHLKKHESDGPTIMDSPKHNHVDETPNVKDDTYFEEIRSFMGKVTNVGANPVSVMMGHHPTAHYLHQAFPENRLLQSRRSSSITSDHTSPPNTTILSDEDEVDCAVPIEEDDSDQPPTKKSKSPSSTASTNNGSDCDNDSFSDIASPKKRMEYRFQRESDGNVDEL